LFARASARPVCPPPDGRSLDRLAVKLAADCGLPGHCLMLLWARRWYWQGPLLPDVFAVPSGREPSGLGRNGRLARYREKGDTIELLVAKPPPQAV